MEGLLKEENEWDNDVSCAKVEGEGCKFGKDEIKRAVKKMKKGKAAANQILTERTIPEDWRRSIIIPVYKGKGDPLDCGSCTTFKLLKHAMKFGFTSGKSTTDAIFVVRQIQEYLANEKKLYYAFVDLMKAFDRVQREINRWALRKSGMEEWLVMEVIEIYVGAQTAVRKDDGDSKSFEVKNVHKRVQNNDNVENGGLDIGNGLTLGKVDKFCYLGYMLNADGGVDSAIVARVRQASKKFKEMSSILTNTKSL
ncbi:uncharacterized protein LOC135927976 [Gordionus sp. m RMFG-2023]|uniref:uncharacterized protein LOC135927976 n=1 Tax=Gordionus sp. m RMFG-2023 TaxID=3053472 RepID=UPI0031FD8513